MNKKFKHILFYVVLIAIVIAVCAFLFRGEESAKMKYSDVVAAFKNEQVIEFEINSDNVLTMTFDASCEEYQKYKSGESKDKSVYYVQYNLASLSIFHADLGELVQEQMLPVYQLDENGNQVLDENGNPIIIREAILKGEYVAPTQYPAWLTYVPIILIVIVLIVIYIIMSRQMANGGAGGKMGGIGNFSKARAKMADAQSKDKVTFRDVAGADEEKEELEEVVEFLKDPSRFAKLGAKIPHGVLLMGPPGTGKTLLAKAVAGEAGVPFFSISGSDFVEMYVGVGASRVRDLFDTARKSPASIIFIDEIDAVGRHRGAGLGGGHDEREQTLNQLLVEMDGFGSHEGIIIIAATNRADILDPALLRPGRFDRQVRVGYPDIRGREAILQVHARKKPMESTVDFHKIAQSTIGFTGADLANLLNEAALHAAKNNKSLIGMEDIEKSYMKILLGPQKKSRVRTAADNKLTAYHEAGHAVASYYCKHTNPVKFISTVPSGNAGGVTVSIPEEDTFTMTKKQMIDEIILALGGRVAEELVLDDISTGASADIQQATKIARNMVTRYGMSDKLGTVLYGSGHSDTEVFLGRDLNTTKNYSEKIAAEIDDEIRTIIENAYAECKAILTEHMDKLHLIAGYLLRSEFMDGDMFKAAMENDLTFEQIDEILKEKERRSQEENEAKRKAEEEEHRKVEEELRREKEEREKMINAPAGETYDDAPSNNEESVDKE